MEATTVDDVAVQKALELVTDVVMASYEVSHRHTARANKRQDKAVAALLQSLLGRKPTAEEVQRVCG